MDDVEIFLSRFHNYDDVDTTFTSGCCYWFAEILMKRFEKRFPVMMYDDIANHFGVMIGERVYDITGDVTDQYKWKKWSEMNDRLHVERIMRDCVNF